MDESIKVLKKAEASISMIKNITIGDPLYFEEGSNGLKYTYSKTFRQKNSWNCMVEVTENLLTCPPDEYSPNELQFKDVYFKIYLACDDKMLNLLKEGKMYTRQKQKITSLGVDSASYILNINSKEDLIRTGGDGWIGEVCEFYTKNKLEAVTIEASLCEDTGHTFESTKKLFEYFLNCEMKDIKIN